MVITAKEWVAYPWAPHRKLDSGILDTAPEFHGAWIDGVEGESGHWEWPNVGTEPPGKKNMNKPKSEAINDTRQPGLAPATCSAKPPDPKDDDSKVPAATYVWMHPVYLAAYAHHHGYAHRRPRKHEPRPRPDSRTMGG